MRQRWIPVVVLTAVLFAVNVIARLVIVFGFPDDSTAQNRASLIMFAVLGVILAGATFARSQREKPLDWLPVIGSAALAGMLLTILVGPLVSGDSPFAGGAGNFFSQIWLYGGFAIAGVLVGHWVATALGRDHRSRALAAYSRTTAAKPRRTVRR